jgi:hypothetical protein
MTGTKTDVPDDEGALRLIVLRNKLKASEIDSHTLYFR